MTIERRSSTVPEDGDDPVNELLHDDTMIKSLDMEITKPLTGERFEEEYNHSTLIEHEESVFPRAVYNWLYPPHIPRECQLMRRENLAVPVCYLLVGLLHGLYGPFTNVYTLALGATEAQQVTVSGIRSLPASFKLIFGFVSDNVPLCGYRRKSYMLLGWSMTSLTLLVLLLGSDLSLDENGDASPNAPSIGFLSVTLLVFGIGFWLADVMGDSIVAEKAKLEIIKGHIQSTCYACRFFGLMVAAPFATYVYSTAGPEYIVKIMIVLPLCILPCIYSLTEVRNMPIKSTKDQCDEIYKTVCSRAVWQPMGFVYLFNILQVSNGAWKEFLKTVLNFTPYELNILLTVASVLLYFGVLAYKYCFMAWSWRTIYICTTSLNAIFSALQILLIQGMTFGLSPFLFALGDEVFADFVSGIQFLPTTIMMVHLCPPGSEGVSYAMFTTCNNAAMTMSSAISTMLLGIWDVSKDAFEEGDTTGMVNLTVLTTVLQLSGVLFVGLLPRTKEDLMKLSSNESRSQTGGLIFLAITFLSIFYALVVGILNIAAPGWAGES